MKTSIFPSANGLQDWTKCLDRKIIDYLEHTGSLSCVNKASERECLARNAGRLCCPTQQYYHPADAKLVSIFDDELENSIMEEELTYDTPRFVLNEGRHTTPPEETSHSYNYWKWSCCAKNKECTGCEDVCDAEEDVDTDAAIQANEEAREAQARQEALDDEEDDYYRRTPDWDDSIGGDAKRWCSCGYKDGVYSYCAC